MVPSEDNSSKGKLLLMQKHQDFWERIYILILWTHTETQMKLIFAKQMQVGQLKFSKALIF